MYIDFRTNMEQERKQGIHGWCAIVEHEMRKLGKLIVLLCDIYIYVCIYVHCT